MGAVSSEFRKRYRFRPQRVPTLAMLVIAFTTVLLGNWQMRRAEEKLALQAILDRQAAAPVASLPAVPVAGENWALRRVSVRGEFLASRMILIDNRVHDGVPGYHVVMPMRMEGSALHVLVNRGWVAAGAHRDRLPSVQTPAGVLTVEGTAVIPASNPYELSGAPRANANAGPVRQNLVIERVAAEQGLALQPVVILQGSAAADGLLRDWPRPDARTDSHRAYALQWYAMALVAVVLWIAFNLKKNDDPVP